MAANPLSLPRNSRVQRPPISFSTPAFKLIDFPCISVRKKPANDRLLLSCCCGAAVAINGNHSSKIFNDSSAMLFVLFQEMGFNEKDTEALLRANKSLIFTPFEYVRRRIQDLQSLGVTDFTLSRLIVKRPDLLTAHEIEEFLSFLVNDDANLELKGKIEPARIERLLNSTEPRSLVAFEKKVQLLFMYGIPKENLPHVLNTVNLRKALCLKSLEEMERMLMYLQHFNGVHLIVRRPAVLNFDLNTQLIPRIGFLLDLSGGNESATAMVLYKFPFVLSYTVDHVKEHVEFLNSYAGLSNEEIFRIVLIYPSLFSASRQRKLQPRIDFLKQCGLSSNDIFKFLIKAPLFLSLSFEGNLSHKLILLVKIGYDNRTKELALAMGAVTRCSCKNLQEVIGLFLNYGLTCEDILDMSKKHPQVLQYNHESLEEKLDYLIEEMGRDVRELLGFPAFLGYKLDDRIKHRYEVKRKILGEGLSINKLLSVSAASFSTKSKRKVPVGQIQVPKESEDK
ncbi:transcription termination factor MTERF8, chloroplastic-like [Primulina eburnea]|uniref:transcription termination factor MTERF8, chloroplastic-like n=1 Tax=Primulina eburnea TaxID=1245227 RepID=UPI003C6BFA4A